MNTRYLIIPAIIVADILSKKFNGHSWSDHNKEISNLSLLALLFITVYAYYNPRFWFSTIVVITGGLLNYFDGLDGVIINPYAIISSDFVLAFNIADAALVFGVVLAIRESVNGNKQQIGSAEWKNA